MPRFGSASSTDLFDLILCKRLDANQGISRGADSDQFIELRLNGSSIPVLRVLNDEHHQKRNNRRACVDNQLPSVREMK
jgi:hypothetical protein